nr:MAG TPA: hypothetical protein [Caudoviricetes sp.]
MKNRFCREYLISNLIEYHTYLLLLRATDGPINGQNGPIEYYSVDKMAL